MSHVLLFDDRDLHFLRRRFAVGRNDLALFDLVEPGDAVLMYFDGNINDQLHREHYGSPSHRSLGRNLRALCTVNRRNLSATGEYELEPQDAFLGCWLFDPVIPLTRVAAREMRQHLPPDGPFDMHGYVKTRYICRFSLPALTSIDLRSSLDRPSWANDLMRELAPAPAVQRVHSSDIVSDDEAGLPAGNEHHPPTANTKELTIRRMADTARDTAAGANGQQVLRTLKNKELRFSNQEELEHHIAELLEHQQGLCAVTGLRLHFDGDDSDPELLCSLDRIDSEGHYERGNLQLVCRFINRWKGSADDVQFRRLIDLVRS